MGKGGGGVWGGEGERERERGREENLFLCGAPAAAAFDGRKEEEKKQVRRGPSHTLL